MCNASIILQYKHSYFSDLKQYSCFVSVSIQSFKNQIAIV